MTTTFAVVVQLGDHVSGHSLPHLEVPLISFRDFPTLRVCRRRLEAFIGGGMRQPSQCGPSSGNHPNITYSRACP
jgi:hypothetical protein